MRTFDDSAGAERARAPRPGPRAADWRAAQSAAGRAAEPGPLLDLQRTVGNSAVVQLLGTGQEGPDEHSPVLDVVGRGGGQPLDPQTRTTMEAGLGADFGDVRLHTDASAATSAQSVQAVAYTVGRDVVFQSGTYQPETPSGQRMLAHELTHVLQQRAGPVDGAAAGGGISVSDPSDRFERGAEHSADRFMADRSAMSPHTDPAPAGVQRAPEAEGVDGTPAGGPAPGDVVQREEMEMEGEDEVPVQGLSVQRADLQELEDQPKS